ncbi:MAG: O-antigen ligase family protein [Candidatus Limnocylindria bacterium]
MSLDALMRRPWSDRSLRLPAVAVGAVGLLLAGAAITSRVWVPGLILVAVALVGLVAYASVHWPRVTIVVVVLSPILDRYVVSGILPSELAPMANFLSEGLLLAVGVILAARAWIEGRLIAAFRHRSTLAFMAFAAVAVISALLNNVPPQIAAIGLLFTVDAAACFYLPRLVGFSQREALAAVGAIVAVVAVAAIVSLAQALLSPTLLGLSPVAGRFGEVYRLASIFDDPNVFGAFLIAAASFTLLAAARLSSRRLRWKVGAIAFLIVLALWFSFSRGAWLALVVGTGTIFAILDRRALLVGIAIVVISFATAVVMPRDLLLSRGEPGSPEPEDRPQLVDSTLDRVGAIGRGEDLRTLFVLNALPILDDHPVVGVGPGRYGGAVAHTFPTPIYPEYGTDILFKNPTQRTVDNFWLHLLVEGGIAGFVAFLTAALIPALRILRSALGTGGWPRILMGGIAAASAGMALSSVSTMLLEANSVGFLFWFLLGIGSLLVRPGGQPNQSRGAA